MQSQRPSYCAIPCWNFKFFNEVAERPLRVQLEASDDEWHPSLSLSPRENLEFRSMNENNRGTNSKWKFYYRPRNFEGHFKTTGKLVSP